MTGGNFFKKIIVRFKNLYAAEFGAEKDYPYYGDIKYRLGTLVLDKPLRQRVESLHLHFNPASRRIECDDPEVWIEDFGTGREGDDQHQFGLLLHGRKIGFGDSSDRRYASRPGVWNIGLVGCYVRKWRYRDAAVGATSGRYTFKTINERNLALAIITVALESYSDGYRHTPSTIMRVSFSESLGKKFRKVSCCCSEGLNSCCLPLNENIQ